MNQRTKRSTLVCLKKKFGPKPQIQLLNIIFSLNYIKLLLFGLSHSTVLVAHCDLPLGPAAHRSTIVFLPTYNMCHGQKMIKHGSHGGFRFGQLGVPPIFHHPCDFFWVIFQVFHKPSSYCWRGSQCIWVNEKIYFTNLNFGDHIEMISLTKHHSQ